MPVVVPAFIAAKLYPGLRINEHRTTFPTRLSRRYGLSRNCKISRHCAFCCASYGSIFRVRFLSAVAATEFCRSRSTNDRATAIQAGIWRDFYRVRARRTASYMWHGGFSVRFTLGPCRISHNKPHQAQTVRSVAMRSIIDTTLFL